MALTDIKFNLKVLDYNPRERAIISVEPPTYHTIVLGGRGYGDEVTLQIPTLYTIFRVVHGSQGRPYITNVASATTEPNGDDFRLMYAPYMHLGGTAPCAGVTVEVEEGAALERVAHEASLYWWGSRFRYGGNQFHLDIPGGATEGRKRDSGNYDATIRMSQMTTDQLLALPWTHMRECTTTLGELKASKVGRV